MNESQIILCGIPSSVPIKIGTTALAQLFSKGLSIENRIAGSGNPQDERNRYGLVCKRIEAAAASLLSKGGSSIQTEVLGPGYFDTLASILDQNPEASRSRLGTSFFPADQVKGHRDAFRNLARRAGVHEQVEVQRRIKFLGRASRMNWHVVEIQNGFSGQKVPPPKQGLFQQVFGSSTETKKAEESVNYQQRFEAQSVPDTITDLGNKKYVEVVQDRVLETVKAVHNGQPGALNFSNLRDDIITKVLHGFVYGKAKSVREPLPVDVVYDDGSQARKFPLFCLTLHRAQEMAALREGPPIRVGMISARHPEMDRKVDMYWYRNQEISTARTQAQTDETGYQKSKQLLEQTRGEGLCRIFFYQTGFEPALVGFYRALVEELMHRADATPSLEVVPYYYNRGEYEPGLPWN